VPGGQRRSAGGPFTTRPDNRAVQNQTGYSVGTMGDDTAAAGLGTRGISEELRRFVAAMPYERRSILNFVIELASSTLPQTTVLDVGAGDAPYRELFTHVNYLTSDWENSTHAGARRADVVADATTLPVETDSVGLVLCTQVLEHVAEPARLLGESFRILERGGRLALTVPLVWQLHELPFDYYRYTASGVEHLLEQAGFIEIEIHARNDSFTTLAQLMLNVGSTMGRAADGLDGRREEAQAILAGLAAEVARLGPLDVDYALPLGYSALAHRP
jgi:SAM-dependent methyltransferase